MEKKDKPRLAEVLGVEEDEVFRIGINGVVSVFRIHNGVFQNKPNRTDTMWDWSDSSDSRLISAIINYPERIVHIPRLTEPELAICKAVGAKWVSRDETDCGDHVNLWREKPTDAGGYYDGGEDALVAQVYNGTFSTIKPGDCIEVED